jgi:hypothetical protein
MPVVVLTELRPGLRKIPLTNVIRAHAALSLGEAKSCTDRYLAGERVAISVATQGAAESLVRDATRVGAVAQIEPTPVLQPVEH